MEMMTMPAKGTVLGSKYILLREIGRGGMGIVFLARHKTLGSFAAVKILLPELSHNTRIRARFIDEAQRHAKLHHQNIVKVSDAEFDGKYCYFVMEYIEGIDLGKRIQQSPLSLEETRRILSQIASGLKYVHDQKLVHRDIKPSNIIIETATGRVVITDFGICKSVVAAPNTSAKTQYGEIVGTLEYLPPEQLSGGKTSISHDIYALGLLVYEMLTRTRAFDSRKFGLYALINEINSVYPPPPSMLRKNIPTSLNSVIRKAIDKDFKLRYSTVTSFYQAFVAAIGNETPVQYQPSPLDFFKRPSVILTSIAVAVTALLVIIILCARPPARGFLAIKSDPIDVNIRLDNDIEKEVTLPWGSALTAGPHKIHISRPGAAKSYGGSFTITRGETLQVDLKNNKAFALLDLIREDPIPSVPGGIDAQPDTANENKQAYIDARTASSAAPASGSGELLPASSKGSADAPQSAVPGSGMLVLTCNVPVRFWIDGVLHNKEYLQKDSLAVYKNHLYVIHVVTQNDSSNVKDMDQQEYRLKSARDILRFNL